MPQQQLCHFLRSEARFHNMSTGRLPSTDGGIQPTVVDAKGDLLVGVAADSVSRLAVGSNDQVLTADSSTATGLKWATPSGGKVVQIVYGNTTTATSSSSSTYADTNLTATITPTSASNNVLVLVSQNNLQRNAVSAAAGIAIRLFRGATNIAQVLSEGAYTNSALVQNIGSASIMLLDSPATTSATTYKTQFANDGNAGTVTVQFQSARSTIILMEVTP